MRKERFPISSRRILDLLVSYAGKAPEETGTLAPHVVIRTIRNALRMTQAQLAKRACMPQSHLAKIETGKVDVQLSTIRKILRAMFCEAVVLPKFLKSPQAAIAERIEDVARRRVARVMGTKALEKRRPDDKTLRALIRSEEGRLMGLPSSEIWEEPPPAADPGGASVVRDRSQAGFERARMPVRMVEEDDDRATLRFWLDQPSEVRINAVEFLRRQCYLTTGQKNLPRLTRSIQLRDRRA
ncbi:MAG: helix-turn-helix domain-containing protein [Elusimicrobia bacterium]|nr:helix-turn-helix domain-containing protein [Elusimicrobiota bacterium]